MSSRAVRRHKDMRPDRVFRHLLADTLAVSVTHFTVWFAITFYVYLQTRSVFATGVIAGLFLVMTSLSGIWFGSLVDHHPKRLVMMGFNGRTGWSGRPRGCRSWSPR
jgi:hypothetical protein